MIGYCIICSKPFKVVLSEIKHGFGRFCSRKCSSVWQSENNIGKNNPNWRGGNIKGNCLVCNREIYILPATKKRGGGKFCSMSCMGTWKSVNLIGVKSHSWQGGITPLQTAIRNSLRYSAWRDLIFKRDGYKCQRCPQVGGELHAHHLKKFSIILNDIRQKFPLLSITDVAESYPDLWKIKNGITLCVKCHKEMHKKDGR